MSILNIALNSVSQALDTTHRSKRWQEQAMSDRLFEDKIGDYDVSLISVLDNAYALDNTFFWQCSNKLDDFFASKKASRGNIHALNKLTKWVRARETKQNVLGNNLKRAESNFNKLMDYIK
jgi:hypothetical protein